MFLAEGGRLDFGLWKNDLSLLEGEGNQYTPNVKILPIAC